MLLSRQGDHRIDLRHAAGRQGQPGPVTGSTATWMT